MRTIRGALGDWFTSKEEFRRYQSDTLEKSDSATYEVAMAEFGRFYDRSDSGFAPPEVSLDPRTKLGKQILGYIGFWEQLKGLNGLAVVSARFDKFRRGRPLLKDSQVRDLIGLLKRLDGNYAAIGLDIDDLPLTYCVRGNSGRFDLRFSEKWGPNTTKSLVLFPDGVLYSPDGSGRMLLTTTNTIDTDLEALEQRVKAHQ